MGVIPLNEAPAARKRLYSLLGDLPDRDRPISAELISKQQKPAYELETLLLDLNGIEPVPAYFVRPLQAVGPTPVILYNHSHGGNYNSGKGEFINGCGYLSTPPYADALTAAGYSALCIDAWNFGERQGRTESELFKELLWQGQVLWGLMVYDSLKAVDYLCQRQDIDTDRIGTLGMSMGSTASWWLAALDIRIKACVDICCLTDFHALIENRGLDSHGIYYYVPSLIKHFDTIGINSLIAPRAHLSIAGDFDSLTPVAGLVKIDAALRQFYTSLGGNDCWKLERYCCGHLETAAARQSILSFLAQHL